MKTETCRICPEHFCIDSTSKLGKVRVEVDKETKTPLDVKQVLIENCPKRLNYEKQADALNDIRSY